MTEPQTAALEFDDIQGPVLLPRPLPTSGPISSFASTILRKAGRCWGVSPLR